MSKNSDHFSIPCLDHHVFLLRRRFKCKLCKWKLDQLTNLFREQNYLKHENKYLFCACADVVRLKSTATSDVANASIVRFSRVFLCIPSRNQTILKCYKVKYEELVNHFQNITTSNYCHSIVLHLFILSKITR